MSEYLILIGTFATHAWWAVVATLGVVRARRSTCSGPTSGSSTAAPRAPTPTIADATTPERWVLVPVVVLIVVLGVFPKPVLDRITPSVQQLIEHVAPAGVTK